ncbi:hypothetical protein MMC12_000305 [Toensbergia leucococca]|nr:hypothetical protein [Toensbergia leucococca]
MEKTDYVWAGDELLSTLDNDTSVSSFFDLPDYNQELPSLPFVSINDPTTAQMSTSYQTISPQDTMLDATSAPTSTTFTELTTPGTSYGFNSTDTSPMFGADELGSDADTWAPLFPGDSNDIGAQTSPLQPMESPSTTLIAPKMSRNKSSPDQSSARSSNQGRHSISSGVNPRTRGKPLAPIKVDDPTDTVAVKRARNTAAARKSRQKRVEKSEEMLQTIAELEKSVDYWKNIALQMGFES